jgi:hypothetical protein
MAHFEISVKLRIFYIPIATHLKKKKFSDLISDFFLFFGTKTHLRLGRHENKETHPLYFCLRILLPI